MQNVQYNHLPQQPCLEENEVCRAYEYYVDCAIAEAKAKGLIIYYGASGSGVGAPITGPALCLYYAAMNSDTGLPSVQFPHFSGGGIVKRLQSSTCPSRFLDFFDHWAEVVSLIQNLPRPQQLELERIICNQDLVNDSPSLNPNTPCLGIPSVHEIAEHLFSIVSDIQRYQSEPLQSGGPKITPIFTTPMWPEPSVPGMREAPRHSPYDRPLSLLPGAPLSPQASPNFSSLSRPAPSFPEPIVPSSSKSASSNVGGIVSGSSNPKNQGDFIGGFVHHYRLTNSSTPADRNMPFLSPASFSMPEPQLGSDIAGSTDQITAAISSSMSVLDIVASLEKHGCHDLSQQLDVSSCSLTPISRGGFGEVYRGKLLDGTSVAVKTVFIHKDDHDQERKHLKRTARELYTWSKCNHPNVAKLLGLAEFRQQIAMVSAWMENGDLRTYVNKNPNVDRLRLCQQVTDGLSYLHSIGIIHGDLKGPNVLISKEGVATVIDFGSAILDESTLHFTNEATDQKISIRWTAPEVLHGGKHSPEADVYALGMETFTGKAPHFEKNNRETMVAIMKSQIPERPQKQIPADNGWGDALWGLLMRCWNRAPEQRPTGIEIRNLRVDRPFLTTINSPPQGLGRQFKEAAKNLSSDMYYQQQPQHSLLEEDEICRAYHYYTDSAIAEATTRGLISRRGTSGADVSFTGAVLCLYYAALRSNTGLSSVQFPHLPGGGMQKRLQSSTCPPRFLDLFNRWDVVVPQINGLFRSYQTDLERILCDQLPLTVPPPSNLYTPYPSTSSVHDIANHLRSLAADILRYRLEPPQNTSASAPPILTTSIWPEPDLPMTWVALQEVPYLAPHGVPPPSPHGLFPSPRHSPRPSPQPSPQPSPRHGPTLSSPEQLRAPELLTPFRTPSPSTGEAIEVSPLSDNGQDAFVGGFVQRRRTTSPSLVMTGSRMPFPSPVPSGMPQPQPARSGLFRNKTVGHPHSPRGDLDDTTGLTDRIAAVISSNMVNMAAGIDDQDQERKHLKRTARELHTWSKCDHPNVANLLGLAEFRGQIAMVSVWMENGDLRNYVNKYPNVDRLKLCAQVADGLAYLHSVGIVHGDLKGPNVLISKEGAATVIDFGNAVLGDSTLQFTDTGTNQKMSIRWTAPEVLEGSKHSVEADVYALGMTILEALTGKVPYSEKHDRAVMIAIMRNEYPPRPEERIPTNTEWGDAIWSLLVRCWDHVPERRPTATEVRDLYESAAHSRHVQIGSRNT
ncbi:hypothetical protein FRC07_013635 [Ceratobasidium sp. 392]|nr:hypothetical protein FRC07_013635 [Ceratobasidium sp. 392]